MKDFEGLSWELQNSFVKSSPPQSWFDESFLFEGSFPTLRALYEDIPWWELSNAAIEEWHWARVEMTEEAKIYFYHRILQDFLLCPSSDAEIFPSCIGISLQLLERKFCGDFKALSRLFDLLSRDQYSGEIFGFEESEEVLFMNSEFVRQFDPERVLDDRVWAAICSQVRGFRRRARAEAQWLGGR